MRNGELLLLALILIVDWTRRYVLMVINGNITLWCMDEHHHLEDSVHSYLFALKRNRKVIVSGSYNEQWSVCDAGMPKAGTCWRPVLRG